MYIGRRTTAYHESFEAEKFRNKLYMQTFAKKLLRNPTYFVLKPYLNSAILKFHIKKFRGHANTVKTVKLFCLKTFMVYGITIKTIMSIYVLAT